MSGMAEGEILVFLQDHLRFEGDWLEGIQAAMERVESGEQGKYSKIKGQLSEGQFMCICPGS